jgi:YVTN family beta-propeller protein
VTSRVLLGALALCLLPATATAAAAKRKAEPPTPQQIREKRLTWGWAAKPPPEGGLVELRLKKTLKVGRWPKGVELTPDQRHALVTNFSARSLMLVGTETLEVEQTVPLERTSPVEVAWFPDGKRAVITGGFDQSEVLIFNLETMKTDHVIPGKVTGPFKDRLMFPKVAAFSPDGERLYVSYWDTNNLAVYAATDFALLGVVRTGPNPRGIAITPDGKKGYVCNFDNNDEKGSSVTVFAADAAPFKVLKAIAPIPNPRHVVMSKDGRFAYVSRFGGRGGLVKIDTAADKVVASSAFTGQHAKTVKLSPDGQFAFLANFGADSVSVFDAATLAEISRTPTGGEPCGLDVSLDGKTLWTTQWKDGEVSVWDIVVKDAAPDAGLPAQDAATP